jgi:Uma2 family endonuclease
MLLIAPEICIEVESPSDSELELSERKRLCFENGAQEFWLCSLEGEMSFFDTAGGIPKSILCPDFPKKIVLD